MSHKYKTYNERIKEIDKNQEEARKIIEGQKDKFILNAIQDCFDTEEDLLKQINRYGIDKSYNNIKTIEDAVLFIIGFCKFISTNSFGYLLKDGRAVKKYVDALNRLTKKGYLFRTKQKDRNQSLYGLTEKGKKKFMDILGSDKILPFSDYNYNTDGIAFHDMVVGSVYLRLLLTRKKFLFSKNYFQRRTLKSDDVYMDAILSVMQGTDEESNYWVEGDTGTEGTNEIIAKIGKYYLKGFAKVDKKNYTMIIYKDNDYSYCQDVYPGLFCGKNKIKKIIQMVNYYECVYPFDLQELIGDYLECPDEEEYWNAMIPLNKLSFAEAIGEPQVTHTIYEMEQYFLYIKTLYMVGCGFYDVVVKIIGENYNNPDPAIMLIDYLRKFNNFNRIEHMINCMQNIEKTRNRRISLVKGIIKRFEKIQDVEYMREAVESIYSGIDTLCVPATICEAYLPYYMPKESAQIYQGEIKAILEKAFKHQMNYAQFGTAFRSSSKFPDMQMRNCYYYIDVTKGCRKEIYVENISASLSAMIRVIILLNQLNGIMVDGRDYHVICLVDCKRDAMLLNKLIKREKKVENVIPKLLYLTYDGGLFAIAHKPKE